MELEDKTNRLNKEVLKIKKGLKDWEHNFYKKYQKRPTLDDIKARPKVERVYKDYNVKKKQLKAINSTQTLDSQSQPLTYYDSFSQPIQQDPFYSSSPSQDNTYMHSPNSSYSPTHQRQRRSSQASIEYIRSPSHKLSRIKYMDHQHQPSTINPFHHIVEGEETSSSDNQHKRKLTFDEEEDDDNNDVEEKRKPKELSISTNNLKQLTEDASFWLSPSSATTTSTPITLKESLSISKKDENNNKDSQKKYEKGENKKIDTFFSSTSSISTDSQSSLNTQKNNSLFSSNTNQLPKKKKKRKNAALEQKIFGHLIWKPRDTQTNESKILDNDNNTMTPNNKRDGKENDFMLSSSSSSSSSTSTSPQSTDTMDHQNQQLTNHLPSSTNIKTISTITTTDNMDENNNNNNEDVNNTTLTLDSLIITERKLDPFRNYDPSLFAWDDPDFVVTPGFFSSVRARSTIVAPMMKDDPSRYQRVLDALKNNTLGEVVRKEEDEVEDLDEDLKRFINEHSINTPTTSTSFA